MKGKKRQLSKESGQKTEIDFKAQDEIGSERIVLPPVSTKVLIEWGFCYTDV